MRTGEYKMAKKSTSQIVHDAELSFNEMQAAIRKIDRRLKELEDFDVDSIMERSDPQIRSIEFSLKSLLVEVFGSGSSQHNTYQGIARIDRAAFNYLHETSIHEVRKGLKSGIAEAIAALQTIKKDFLELRGCRS
jgi:hypothetical protein